MSLRYRIWDLRMACLKKMVPLFTAYDHTCYQKLIPQHLVDVSRLPDCLKAHFRRGAFSIRLTQRDWCGIAIDECHETKINRDCKMAIVQPSKEKMSHSANYLGFRAKMIQNLKAQILPSEETANCHIPTSRATRSDENIKSMIAILEEHGLIDGNDTQLCTLIEHKKASNEQKEDLLSFREIGQSAFEDYVKHSILNRPTTAAPTRRKKLLTFTVKESQKRKVALVEKERKITQKFLKRQLAWMAENNNLSYA